MEKQEINRWHLPATTTEIGLGITSELFLRLVEMQRIIPTSILITVSIAVGVVIAATKAA